MLAPATVSSSIGDYLSALIIVYLVIVLLFLLTNMIFSFGARPPYAAWSEAVLNFIRDVSMPYLRVFRRFIPRLGPIDLSAWVAILVLFFLDEIVRRIFNA
jgi:YggT family protein